MRRSDRYYRAGDLRLRLLFLGAELDHEARQELGLELRIGRPWLPHRAVLARPIVDLGHASVTDVNVATRRRALDAGTKFVELAGRVDVVEDFADRPADDVVRKLGAVFRPVGLEHAGLGAIFDELESVVLPECPYIGIDVFGRLARAQPALVAETLEVKGADRLRRSHRGCAGGRGRPRRRGLKGRGADAAAWLLVARFARELGQVRRHLEAGRARRAPRAIVDLVAGKQILDRRAAGEGSRAEEAGEDGTESRGEAHSSGLHRWRVNARRVHLSIARRTRAVVSFAARLWCRLQRRRPLTTGRPRAAPLRRRPGRRG